MRVSFHLVYRYIFCLPNRRSMQIIAQVLNIIYSFCSFGIIVTKLCSYVCCSARCCSSWQHSPFSSFSFECIPQHFFSFIDTFHTLPCNHNYYKNILHTYQNVPLKNSDNYSYSSYMYPLCSFKCYWLIVENGDKAYPASNGDIRSRWTGASNARFGYDSLIFPNGCRRINRAS